MAGRGGRGTAGTHGGHGGGALTRDAPARDAPARDAPALLAAIAAEPRPAGSAAEARARARCAARLWEAGFQVREEPFGYSALPGRWGTPLGGVLSIAVLALAATLGARGAAGAALALLAGSGAVLALAGRWVAREGVLRLPLLRRHGINLVATRDGAPASGAPPTGAPASVAPWPAVWLMAHLDSKSQPVPIGVRALGVSGSIVAWLAAVALAVAALAGADAAGLWPWVAGLGVVSGVPVALTTVGARSAGAVDDASGAVAVVRAAERVPRDVALGVLLTSAEELGLAGARAWAVGAPRAGTVLNVDGVDDAGGWVAMYTGRAPVAVLRALERAGAALEAGEGGAVRVASRRLLPGILTDGVALADAGWPAVTLSRGTAATLRRIHTRRDDLAHTDGRSLEAAAALLAAAAAQLAADAVGPPPA